MYLSSISIELGTGILDHNNRKFIAENVDRERMKNLKIFPLKKRIIFSLIMLFKVTMTDKKEPTER
jgi:hypothetical protein